MKAHKSIATFRRLRTQPLWRLLAAPSGPTVIALLQSHFADERSLPASILHERIGRDLEHLRSTGEDWPQTAQAYVAGWLAEGYLERHFPTGAAEEEYSLPASTADAIRFAASIERPHSAATESRLTLVIDALVRLADDTDRDRDSRVARLRAEQDRIAREIADIENGVIEVLPDARALERVREIITLADALTSDFGRVREQFAHLNRDLRERVMENDGSRGNVLDSLFAGIDLISDSDAGRSFAAFWRLLTDPEQSAALDQALDQVLAREFASVLSASERKFLLRLTRTLLEQGGAVHDVLQAFARSLKTFVQSREFLEQRRLNQLLKEAQREALALKEVVKPTETLHYSLTLATSSLSSIAQWVLHDPAEQALPTAMREADPAAVDLATIAAMVAESEIDFRALERDVARALERDAQVSVAQVLERFPAQQGLGSVVGLLALGSRKGIVGTGAESVSWTGNDGALRSARIPKVYFVKENNRGSA